MKVYESCENVFFLPQLSYVNNHVSSLGADFL